MTEVTPGIYWLKMPITMEESSLAHVNAYLIRGDSGYLLVDAGWNTSESFDTLQKKLAEIGADIKDISQILVTHIHPDHYGMAGRIKQLSGASITIHPVQKKFYNTVVIEGARVFGLPPTEFKEDACLDSDRLRAGNTEFELILSPGHSPDCVCFYCREDRVLVCGDVVFDHNTGRVDLPGGNADELKKSIYIVQQDIADCWVNPIPLNEDWGYTGSVVMVICGVYGVLGAGA